MLPSWLGANERMQRYFGGVRRCWTALKSAVTTPCRYEPKLNRSYEELAHHYGTVVLPARPREPKVDATVLVVTRWLLAALPNQVFFSLNELNAALRRHFEHGATTSDHLLGLGRR